MKVKRIFSGLSALLILAGFITMPSELIKGATRGLLICSDVIIPSLFPFTAVALFLFNCGFMRYIERLIDPISKKALGLNGSCFCILLMSFVGGFPVGARLIDEAVSKNSLSNAKAQRMLCYCVNPGPAFIIIGIGETLLQNRTIGVILYASNIISSLLVCIALSFKERKEKSGSSTHTTESDGLADLFVKSVSDASHSIIGICGFVILFSTIIGIISNITDTDGRSLKHLIALLEISNGTVLISKNIPYLSFLIAFSGFCVHMQILTMCKSFRVKYYLFFISRIIGGVLSASITMLLLRIFRITVPVLSLNKDLFDNLTGVSLPLSAALIFMSVTLLVSLKQNNVEKS